MNQKGITLIELLIALIVMGIIATFTIQSFTNVLGDTKAYVDEVNAKYIADKLEELFIMDVLEVNGAKVHNNETGKNYTGTGRVFYGDLEPYFGKRIIPLQDDLQNDYNKTKDGYYRYRFDVFEDHIDIYYFDLDKNKVVISLVNIQ
jgi:prepilin-type N-terminal cleavage/methylation domain-containing protein